MHDVEFPRIYLLATKFGMLLELPCSIPVQAEKAVFSTLFLKTTHVLHQIVVV